MALVATGGLPLIPVGQASRPDSPWAIPAATNVTVDAAKEAIIYIGRVITSDGGSHTIDTTGSSSLGWRTSTVTFANAGTTVKVGLAAVDAATGPPAVAVNVADVITFDVAAVLTGGGGGITTTAWQTSVPTTGTKTIANGDLVAFAIQMTARGGAADSVIVQSAAIVAATGFVFPCVTSFTGAAYALVTAAPNVLITFSDGATGYFMGGALISSASNTSFNSGSSPNEYGNLFNMPFPCRILGIAASLSIVAGADFNALLYTTPLGTPSAAKTFSQDSNNIGQDATGRMLALPFASAYDYTANTDIVAAIKPTTTNSVTVSRVILNASAHQAAYTFGAGSYAVGRASGAFAAENSSKDRFVIGLLLSAFDAGGSGGPLVGVGKLVL